MNQRIKDLLELFYQIHNRMGELGKEDLKRHNISFTNLIIMTNLDKAPGMTVSEAARRSGLAKSYVSTTIEELCHQGLAEKRPDSSDNRILRTFLTEPGVRLVEETLNSVNERFARLLDQMPVTELEGLIEGLTTLRGIIEREKDDGPDGG